MKVLVILGCVTLAAFAPTMASDFDAETIKAIATKLQENPPPVVKSATDLKITTDVEKHELIVMASEYNKKILEAIQLYDQAILHIENEEYRSQIEKFKTDLVKALKEIQQNLYGDTATLQQKLADGMEGYARALVGITAAFNKHQGEDTFIAGRFRKASNVGFYGVQKLQHQINLFTKTNAELSKPIETAVNDFENAFKKVVSDDEATKNELTHLAQRLSELFNEQLAQLQYWMGLNAEHASYETVRETSVLLGELAGKLHGQNSAQELLKKLVHAYKTGALKIEKLADIVENLEEREHIRGVLFGAIAIGSTFAEEIDVFVSERSNS